MLAALMFFRSGPGKLALVALALIAWTVYVAHYASSSAWAKAEVACQEAVTERTTAEVDRQRGVTDAALAEALGRAADAEAERNDLTTRIESLVAGLRGNPADSCTISDALRRELQSIN